MRATMKMAAIEKGAKLNKLRIHSMAKKMLKKEQNKGIFKEMIGRHDELLAKLMIKQETGSLILTQDSPNSFSCASATVKLVEINGESLYGLFAIHDNQEDSEPSHLAKKLKRTTLFESPTGAKVFATLEKIAQKTKQPRVPGGQDKATKLQRQAAKRKALVRPKESSTKGLPHKPFVKIVKDIVRDFAGEPLRMTPDAVNLLKSAVEWRYRRIRMAARQCAIVGARECWHARLTTTATSGRVMVVQSRPPTRER